MSIKLNAGSLSPCEVLDDLVSGSISASLSGVGSFLVSSAEEGRAVDSRGKNKRCQANHTVEILC